MLNSFRKFNYENPPTSVKFYVSGSIIVFSGLSYNITFFIDMPLLNAILLQMFQIKMKIYSSVLPLSLAEHQLIFKICASFICNDECISYSNPYSQGGTGRCEMDCTKERSIERSKYYESDKDSWFFKGSGRFKIFCKRESFNPFTHIIYYHKSCYINYTNNHTGSMRIVKNKEAFLMYHILDCLKKL